MYFSPGSPRISQIIYRKLPKFWFQTAIPALQGVIIMGPCVNHTIFIILMRQIVTVFRIVKGKLQHLHSWKACILDQLSHRRSQKAQIFCDDVQMSEPLFHSLKKRQSRSFLPMAPLCGLISKRNGPVFIKASKMVYPHRVIQTKAIFHPSHPPIKSGFLMVFPPI